MWELLEAGGAGGRVPSRALGLPPDWLFMAGAASVQAPTERKGWPRPRVPTVVAQEISTDAKL